MRTDYRVIHNSCIRNCLRSHRLTPSIDLYSQSGVLPLYIQRRINTCNLVHRGLNQNSTAYINDLFNLASSRGGRILRSEIRGDVEIPRYRLEIRKGNVAYRGPKYYNNIPKEAREIESNKSFTRKLTRVAKESLNTV